MVKDADDAVTKGCLESLIPIKIIDDYSFKYSRVQDVGGPVDEGDAINMKYARGTL